MSDTKPMTEKELRDMPLHALEKVAEHLWVRRVVGGWLYYDDILEPNHSVFVPDPEALTQAIQQAFMFGYNGGVCVQVQQ